MKALVLIWRRVRAIFSHLSFPDATTAFQELQRFEIQPIHSHPRIEWPKRPYVG